MQLAQCEQARQHSDQLCQKSTRPRLGPRIPYCRNCKGLLTPAQQYARSQKRLAQETRGKDHKQQTKESPRRSRHPASEKPHTISARTFCRSQAGADMSDQEANVPMVGRRIRKLHEEKNRTKAKHRTTSIGLRKARRSRHNNKQRARPRTCASRFSAVFFVFSKGNTFPNTAKEK